eukprot:6625297-Karenia_brevis.AAC.1
MHMQWSCGLSPALAKRALMNALIGNPRQAGKMAKLISTKTADNIGQIGGMSKGGSVRASPMRNLR